MTDAYHHPGQQDDKSGSKRAPMKPATMQLNLTSMIDVVFQLLIYFIITANFALDEGLLTAQLPQRGQGAAVSSEDAKRVDIFVRSFGAADPQGYTLEIRGIARPSNFDELTLRLQEMLAGTVTKETPVIIHAANDVRWQHVVNAFNSAAQQAGFLSVGFASMD